VSAAQTRLYALGYYLYGTSAPTTGVIKNARRNSARFQRDIYDYFIFFSALIETEGTKKKKRINDRRKISGVDLTHFTRLA